MKQRGEVALEVGGFVELAGEADGAVRSHADFLAKLAQHGVARVLVGRTAAAGQPPARRVAQLDEDDLAFRRQRERVRAESARPANEPAAASAACAAVSAKRNARSVTDRDRRVGMPARRAPVDGSSNHAPARATVARYGGDG